MLNMIITWGRICVSVGTIGIPICCVALAGIVLCIAGWLVHDAIADRKFGCTILAIVFCLLVLGVFINTLLMLWNSIMVVLRMW